MILLKKKYHQDLVRDKNKKFLLYLSKVILDLTAYGSDSCSVCGLQDVQD